MSAVTTLSVQAKTEWARIFNTTFNDDCTSSATFMKQLTTIAISTITYLKSIFPEESFKCETFAGLQLSILKDKCKDENADFVSTTLQQVFEAFEKKYLYRLALCFHGADSELDEIVEYYIFDYTYTEFAVIMTIQSERLDVSSSPYSFENIRDQTVKLLRSCVVLTRTHKSFPTSDITFRLYYNKNAPMGYQAPGFNPWYEPADPLVANPGLQVGIVHTRFHRLKLSTHQLSNQESNEAIPSQNPPTLSQLEDVYNDVECETPPDTNSMRCPCNSTSTATNAPLLLCMYCGRRQHAPCFGIMEATRARHCCDRCAAPPDRVPTDDFLNTLQRLNRQSYCAVRHCLWWFTRLGATGEANGAGKAGTFIDRSQLNAVLGISQTSAAKLIQLLQHHGILQGDSASTYKIIKEQLKIGLVKFFLPDQSVESKLHPRAESDTPSIREIDPPNPPLGVDDSTLNLYKQVVLENDGNETELLLSGFHNPVGGVRNAGKKLNKRKSNSDTEESKNVTTNSKVVQSKRLEGASKRKKNTDYSLGSL